MFYNNEKINAVAEAVKKIMEVPEVVKPVVQQTAHVPFTPLEEDMHKPLLPKQKQIQKDIDRKSKRQMPSKVQAGTLAAHPIRAAQMRYDAKNKMKKEESEQVDEEQEEHVLIHVPGNIHHGKKARVFYKHPDGRINVQLTHSQKKGDIDNFTLKPGNFKPIKEEAEQVNEVNTPGHITRALEDKYGPAQATMVNSSKTEVTHLTRHLDDDGGDAYEQRTHKLHLGPTGKLKDSTIGKLISHKGKPKKKVVDMDEEVEQVDEANYTNIPSVVSNKVASGMTRAMHKAAAKRYEADADGAHKEGNMRKRDWANDMAKNHHQAAKEMESVKEEKTFKDRLIEGMKQKENPEELLPDLEEEMSDSQKKKREEIVMSMKDKTSYFKKKYGAKWKNVMYATATKQAMGEQIIYDDYIYDRVVEATHDDEEEDEKQMKAHNADPDSHKPAIKKMVKKDCLKSEEVEQIEEGLMTGITLGKKVKNDEGGHDQVVHHKGKKIGTISSYSHRTGTRYGMTHDASNDATAGSRSHEEALADLRYSHAEHLKSMKNEEVDQYDEEEHAGHLAHAARQAAKSGKKVFTLGGKTFPVKVKAVKENNESHTHAAHYEDSKTGEWTGMKLIVAKDDKDAIEQAHKNCEDGCRLSKVERHIPVKEEVEQVDEISTKLANRYFSKAGKQSRKPGAKNRDRGMVMAYKKVQGRHANVPTTEEVELDEGYSAHTHTVHFSDPESGEWKGKMLIVADNDNEAVEMAHDMAKDNDLKVMKVSKNHLVMMDRTIGEDVDSEEEVIFEADSQQNVDDEDITTDMLRGRVAGGKVNSFKNFKVKLKSDREYPRAPDDKDSIPASTAARASITAKKWDPPSNVKTEEVDHIDEAKLPPLHKRTERQQIAHDLGLDQEYSQKYPGGEKQRTKDKAAFLKRFPPPKNEEVEQVDEKKKSHMLVVPKKPDPKTGRKDVKKIPSHMWAQMKDTHYQAEEVDLEEGKDPSMDAGVGSEASFVQNANTSSNPSPKHTAISYAKNLAHKAMQKIKADLGHK